MGAGVGPALGRLGPGRVERSLCAAHPLGRVAALPAGGFECALRGDHGRPRVGVERDPARRQRELRAGAGLARLEQRQTGVDELRALLGLLRRRRWGRRGRCRVVVRLEHAGARKVTCPQDDVDLGRDPQRGDQLRRQPVLLTIDSDDPVEAVEAPAEGAVDEGGQTMAPFVSQPDDDGEAWVQVEDEGPLAAGPELGQVHAGREYAADAP